MRRAVRLGGLALGLAAWSVYQARLLLRSTHMLQIEGYETLRFLRWARRNPRAWLPSALLRSEQTKKAFVPTARAKRLLAGEAALLGLAVVSVPRLRSATGMCLLAAGASLLAPLLTA